MSRKPLTSLPSKYYLKNKIYQKDIEKIWKRSWLFAGFTCSIPKEGDFLKFNMDKESVIITRDPNGDIKSFINLCRHRGSRLTNEDFGNFYSNSIVCKYHGWTYDLNGKLKKANYMDNKLCKGSNLFQLQTRTVAGLIFINFDPKPIFSFEEAWSNIIQELHHHKLDNAKIAKHIDYDIKANWKIVYENNRECYHCPIAHPEYIQSNYDTSYIYKEIPGITVESIGDLDYINYPDRYNRVIDPNSLKGEEIKSVIQEKLQKWKQYGISCSPDSNFPDDGWYRSSRVPLKKDFLVESLDGQPVSTLMGSFTDYDMGSCRIHTLPNFWLHASSDHAVSTMLWPISKDLTKARVSWLVDSKAKEGKDYHLDKLLPFWQKTSEQDWQLCENVQLGIQSKYYQPGRLSESKEIGVERFTQWYFKTLNL